MTTQEIMNIVSEINDNIIEIKFNNKDLFISLEYRSSGYVDYIYFLDQIIWSSEDDERVWIEEENDYEPLSGFLVDKIIDIVNDFSKLRNIKRLRKLKRVL